MECPWRISVLVIQYLGRAHKLDGGRRHHGEKAVRHGNDEGDLRSSSDASHLDVRSPGRDVQRQVCAFTGGCIRDGGRVGVAVSIERRQGAERPSSNRILYCVEVGHGHRLYACWLLSMYGLRRSEVLGLRWADLSGTEALRL